MRRECEFQSCYCDLYSPPISGQLCAVCGHGECWHASAKGQFESPRQHAAWPIYTSILLPLIPPLPLESIPYCTEVILLPV